MEKWEHDYKSIVFQTIYKINNRNRTLERRNGTEVHAWRTRFENRWYMGVSVWMSCLLHTGSSQLIIIIITIIWFVWRQNVKNIRGAGGQRTRLFHENQPSDSGNDDDDDDDAFEVRTGRLTRSLRNICVSCRSRSFRDGTNFYAHRVTSNGHERRNGPYFALFHRAHCVKVVDDIAVKSSRVSVVT